MTAVPRTPPAHWTEERSRPLPPKTRCFEYGGLRVLSTLDDMEAPDGSREVIPQWHVSVSRRGKRPDDADVARALRAFQMENAEEDNHHPGVARHFFMPVDPSRRVTCECKTEETVVTEPDGYRWSNDLKACRGCDFAALTGRRCALHLRREQETAHT